MPDKEDEELERELWDLAPRIEYPPTPDVARTVRRRLDAEPAPRRGRLRTLATPKWAAAAAAVILVSLAVLSPAMRSIVSGAASSGAGGGAAGQAEGGGDAAGVSQQADGGVASPPDPSSPGYAAGTTQYGRGGRVGSTGAASSSAGAAASSGAPEVEVGSPGAGLGLGERLPMSEVRGRVGELLRPGIPELTVGPGVFYAGGPLPNDAVVLVLRPGPGLPPLGDADVGLLLVETRGDVESAYLAADGATRPPLEEVEVGGRPGYWLPDGRALRPQPGEAGRLPGGALVWSQGDVALLLRADVPREEAVRIAETVR